MRTVTREDLRSRAVAQTLFPPTRLQAALDRLGYVQADPIRAPARAQDLILRHRVEGYRAGDLEREYRRLDVQEDFFVNYGFLPTRVRDLMHPRGRLGAWPRPGRRMSEAVLAFVRTRGDVHPRDVDAHFAHGAVKNYWGGSSSATTHALDHLHYRGLLRVTGRESGIRRYAVAETLAPSATVGERRARLDALVDVLLRVYAPLPAPTLSWLLNRMRIAAPQWAAEVPAALTRVKARAARVRVDDIDYFWPADVSADAAMATADTPAVRLLAPFDPVVWDRRRFEHLWEWAYRFEAYTPAAKRQLGYYALPVLWRQRVVGWANVTYVGGEVRAELGYRAGRPPRDRAYRDALAEELSRIQVFLGGKPTSSPRRISRADRRL